MEKLNIGELLKDCPKGMELDCTCADNVVFDKIIEYDQIRCVIGECREPLILDKYGRLLLCCPKCVIFPKGKTTWDGFQRPFKDGDVVFYSDTIAIFKGWGDETLFRTYVKLYIHKESIDVDFPLFGKYIRKEARFATSEEKQKLFDAIKANGYKWNPETRTSEKLIIPKFKVGNKIKKCGNRFIITEIKDNYYLTKCCNKIPIDNQDDYELVTDKFNITTLKPFKDNVLIRDSECDLWEGDIFIRYSNNKKFKFRCLGGSTWKQCIPYKGNEHLLGTSNNCDDFYKTWE